MCEHLSSLSSLIEDSGRVAADVYNRLAKAFKAFGALRRAVFTNINLHEDEVLCVPSLCSLHVAV